MKMPTRPQSAAVLRKSAYTQSAQYTHPSLFPLFRRASTPITEVIDDQVPHQTDGTLMRGVEGRAAVVLGRPSSPWRAECIPASPLPKIPPTTTRQGRGHVYRRGSTLTGRRGCPTHAGIVLFCEQLKACQMEIQRDRAMFDFSAHFLRCPYHGTPSRVTYRPVCLIGILCSSVVYAILKEDSTERLARPKARRAEPSTPPSSLPSDAPATASCARTCTYEALYTAFWLTFAQGKAQDCTSAKRAYSPISRFCLGRTRARPTEVFAE